MARTSEQINTKSLENFLLVRKTAYDIVRMEEGMRKDFGDERKMKGTRKDFGCLAGDFGCLAAYDIVRMEEATRKDFGCLAGDFLLLIVFVKRFGTVERYLRKIVIKFYQICMNEPKANYRQHHVRVGGHIGVFSIR